MNDTRQERIDSIKDRLSTIVKETGLQRRGGEVKDWPGVTRFENIQLVTQCPDGIRCFVVATISIQANEGQAGASVGSVCHFELSELNV